jgi:cytoskeletal protein RodZ
MSNDETQSLSKDTAPDREPTVGERLKTARLAQPLSLAQIAAQLRIEQQFLLSLEQDRLDVFSAPVFAKGYLKQYGNLLGLDERDLIAQYYRQADVPDVPVVGHKPIRLHDEDQIRLWIVSGLVLLGLAAGFVWWFSRPEPPPLTTQPAVRETPQLVAPVEPVTTATSPEEPEPQAQSEPAAGGNRRSRGSGRPGAGGSACGRVGSSRACIQRGLLDGSIGRARRTPVLRSRKRGCPLAL